MRKWFVVLLAVILTVFVLAEGDGHVHDEECGCEIADARDISLEETEIVFEESELNIEELVEKISVLEENLNLIYEILGTKAQIEDLETYREEIQAILDELETRLLNVESTVRTGLPSISSLVYELSSNIAELEEKLTSYVQVSLDGLKEEILTSVKDELSEKMTVLEDIKVTLDIHDSDILKIYETLGNMTEKLSELEKILEITSGMSETLESLALKLELHDQDIVNIYDNLANKADRSELEELEMRLTKFIEQSNGEAESWIKDRFELLEEYMNMVYEVANSKVSASDVEDMLEPLKADVEKVTNELSRVVRKLNEQDVDIIKLYDAVAKLAEELRRISGRLATLESIVNELRSK
ncbi:hypothetical protein [Fervidobacterium thailandense]|uniref:Uncharacterized protein n=1 Tax=Fervidobacterium thailandense TaxID=1008305 RepID=A0A1E3G2H0_9BACT|nr:hypothetical protein [Fervidobacterium thailandense]ODN30330.1 hypothetical protein A4H02_05610 [Fervidobacterium thailandense]